MGLFEGGWVCSCVQCRQLRRRHGPINDIKAYLRLEWPGLNFRDVHPRGVLTAAVMLDLAYMAEEN